MAFEQAPGRAVDVGEVLDHAPFLGLPALVCLFTALALVFDGFDIQAIAFAAPALLTDWQIERSQLAPILAAGLVGMGVGALALGSAGDRYGRRRALMASMALISLTSLLCAFASSPIELTAYRFLTGIGLGGALPNATALMAEFAPLIVRNVAVAVTVVGVPIGGMLGATVAADLVPRFGWPSIFLAGAVLPGLLTLGMWLWLPESPRYLAVRTRRMSELASLLNSAAGSVRFHADDVFRVAESVTSAGSASVRALFVREMRHDTLAVWLVFFTNVFAVYAFFNWLPTVLASVGLPLATALRGAFVFNLGGVVGSLAAAVLMTRFGSRYVLVGFALIAALSTLSIGLVPVGPGAEAATLLGLLLTMMGVAGACICAVQVGMYSVSAYVYPTACRATGVGWALGVARLGGVLSSFAGSLLVVVGEGLLVFFAGVACVLLLTLTGVLLLRRHIPRSARRA